MSFEVACDPARALPKVWEDLGWVAREDPLPEGHCLERLPESSRPDVTFSSGRAQVGLPFLGPSRGPRTSVERLTCRHSGHVYVHAASSRLLLPPPGRPGLRHFTGAGVRGPLSRRPLDSMRGSCPTVCEPRSRHQTRAAVSKEEPGRKEAGLARGASSRAPRARWHCRAVSRRPGRSRFPSQPHTLCTPRPLLTCDTSSVLGGVSPRSEVWLPCHCYSPLDGGGVVPGSCHLPQPRFLHL